MSSASPSNSALNTLWSHNATIVIDRAGMAVDLSGRRWRLNDPLGRYEIDWARVPLPEGDHLNSVRSYVRWLITTKHALTVHNAFKYLLPLIKAPAFQRAAVREETVPYLAFSQARESLGPKNQWQLHYARQLYRWAVSQGHQHFSREVLNRLDEVVVGGNAKGQAVRSRDPDKGPLDASEIAALTLALRAARAEGSMPLREQAAVWLVLATGSNAGQYASMREDDVVAEKIEEAVAAWIVRIPRHKKGEHFHRKSFRERRVNRFIGAVLADLVAENQSLHPSKEGDTAARPLFRSPRAGYAQGDPLYEWAWHLTTAEFTRLIKRAIKRLRVRSRTGGPLAVSTRRFRYSLATRLIQNGASMLAVADALDHSDTQNVGVYFDVHSDIVEHLDKAMALALAPRAQAFASIVRNEGEAQRGDHKGSRRYFSDRERDVFEPLGTCGSHSFCNINAPLACYTCVRFQAWMDGPHELVLDSLLEARERRRDLGLSPKMVAIEDELIAAVADVIIRIAEMRGLEAHND